MPYDCHWPSIYSWLESWSLWWQFCLHFLILLLTQFEQSVLYLQWHYLFWSSRPGNLFGFGFLPVISMSSQDLRINSVNLWLKTVLLLEHFTFILVFIHFLLPFWHCAFVLIIKVLTIKFIHFLKFDFLRLFFFQNFFINLLTLLFFLLIAFSFNFLWSIYPRFLLF